MFYITGDTHRNFRQVAAFCDTVGSTVGDVLIILGDAGINYYGSVNLPFQPNSFPAHEDDRTLKRLLAELPITLFCIHGNHEQRPETLGYDEMSWRGGAVYLEPEFPNLLFAEDGEIYDFDGRRCLAIGGAYSIDKHYRLSKGMGWWEDEQPSAEIRNRVEARLDGLGWQVDIVLSHTCPLKYEPRETFLTGINQMLVDKSTERWLDAIEDRLTYDRWYCGHFHVYKTIDKLKFLFNDFLELK